MPNKAITWLLWLVHRSLPVLGAASRRLWAPVLYTCASFPSRQCLVSLFLQKILLNWRMCKTFALKVCLNGWNLSYDQLVDIGQTFQLYKIEGNTLNYVPSVNCFMAHMTFHLMFYCLVPVEELTVLVII